MTNLIIPVYAAYAVVAMGLVFWLARTLFDNGEVFLEDVFADNPRLAHSVNRLLVTGFYMANLGYAAILLRSNGAETGIEAVEILSTKLGVLLLTLAALHFVNVYVFHRIRRRATAAVLPPPVAPQTHVPPPPPAEAEWHAVQ